MKNEFYASIIPEPWRILGLELRPFSLGHYIVLSRLESPLLQGGGAPYQDILTAVLMCSKTFKECVDALDDPLLTLKVRDWARDLTGSNSWSVILGFKKPAVIDWESKVKMFRDYMEQGEKMPSVQYPEEGVKDINIPTPQIVKITLQMKLGLDDEAIMDRSWSLCLWDFATIKAIEGVVDVVDADDMRAAQDMANELFYKHNPQIKRN